MPQRPKHACNKPLCRRLTRNRFCDEHTKAYNRQRPTSAQRGYNARWRKLRAWHVRRYPMCVTCEREGRCTPAKEVHHRIPHKGDEALLLDVDNLESLCKSCHSKATRKEQQGG